MFLGEALGLQALAAATELLRVPQVVHVGNRRDGVELNGLIFFFFEKTTGGQMVVASLHPIGGEHVLFFRRLVKHVVILVMFNWRCTGIVRTNHLERS